MYRVITVWAGVAVGGGVTTTYWDVSGGGSNAEAQAAVDFMRDFWTTSAPRISASGSWTVQSTVDRIRDTDGTLMGSHGVTARSGLGTASGDFLPLQVQGMVRWDTGIVMDGHRLRGRTFMPGPAEVDNGIGGVPSSAYLTTINGAAATLAAASPPSMLIWHRPIAAGEPGGPRNGGSGLVISGVCLGQWKTQRRRST